MAWWISRVEVLAQRIECVLVRGENEWCGLSTMAYATVASISWEASTDMFERALQHACRRAARGEIAEARAADAKKGDGIP
jgi:hypothetical protein